MENLKLQLAEIELLIMKAKEISHNIPECGDRTIDSVSSRIYDRILLVEEHIESAHELLNTKLETVK